MTLSLAELGLQLLSAYTDGICVFDRDLKVLYWNAGMEQIFGLREDTVRGQPLLDWALSAPAENPAAQPNRVFAGDHFFVPDLPFLIKETGKSGFVECTYRPLRDGQGMIHAGIALVRDVTRRRQAEAEMREVESRFQRMADSSPVLLWMAGLDGECNFFNQTWLRFTGRSLAQEYGVGWAEGVHPFDFQHCMDIYVDNFNARKPFEMEYRLKRADGEYRWILDRGAPRFNLDGSFAGFIGSCTDISDRKNAELALQEALTKAVELSRLKSEFLANISHELRTPLNAIINVPIATLREFPTLPVWECTLCKGMFQKKEEDLGANPDSPTAPDDLAAQCPECGGRLTQTQRPYYVGDPGKTAHFLDRLVQASQHMLKVVTDLLDFSKLDAGRTRLFISRLSTHEVLTEVAQTIAALVEDKRLTVAFPAAEAAQTVLADRVKLTQMLLNLLGNAIKYTPPEGAITVNTFVQDVNGTRCVGFAVSDTGIGIPESKFEDIFESFRQADGGHTRAHQGTGLGLSITRKLAELHGGRVTVKSEVGIGSTFTLLLPLEPIETLLEAQAKAGKSQGKVLVIDDNPTDLEIVRSNLEREGFEVSLIAHPEMALSAVQELQPDCVILDVMMPKMSGLTILRLLKKEPTTRAIPVLVSTAYHSNRELVAGLGGIWLPKPWDASDLMACVRGNIGQYRSVQAGSGALPGSAPPAASPPNQAGQEGRTP